MYRFCQPPPSRRVYMVVEDEADKLVPSMSEALIKREKAEVSGLARGGSSRVLPSRLGQGGDSQGQGTQEEEEDSDDEEIDEGGDREDGGTEPPTVEAQGESQEEPRDKPQLPTIDEEDDSLYDPSRYRKSDIIELHDIAFRGDTKESS